MTVKKLDEAIRKVHKSGGRVTKQELVKRKLITRYAIDAAFPSSTLFGVYLEKRHPNIARANERSDSKYSDFAQAVAELLK
jgi:hypothetical protein